MSENVGSPTFLEDEEEVLGDPSFEMWVLDGRPMVSGCYFMVPPLQAVDAEWDPAVPGHLMVKASDGSGWEAFDVATAGSVNVHLVPRVSSRRPG